MSEEVKPATDEEIADTAARAKRVTGIGSVRALKLISRIDAERALNAEMLEALKDFREPDGCDPDELMARVNAVIAKAEGKAK